MTSPYQPRRSLRPVIAAVIGAMALIFLGLLAYAFSGRQPAAEQVAASEDLERQIDASESRSRQAEQAADAQRRAALDN